MPPFRTNSQNTYNKNPFSSLKSKTEDVKLDPILNLGLAFAFISCVLGGALYYLNNKYENDLKQKKALIEEKSLELKDVSLEEMTNLYTRYNIVAEKENSRALLNSVFEYLSYVVIPGVYFSNFQFTATEDNTGIVTLTAVAIDLKKSILQMDSFRNSPYNKFILKEDISMDSFKDENGRFQILLKMKVKTNLKNMEFIPTDYIEEDKLDYSIFFNRKKATTSDIILDIPKNTDLITNNEQTTSTSSANTSNVDNTINPRSKSSISSATSTVSTSTSLIKP